jgi:hypothetical protein
LTTPPPQPVREGRDSLLIAGSIELLGGGIPSTHPACPGAIFRLAPEYDLGAAQPSADVVARLLQGGSRPHGRWADNRQVTLPVIILGPDRGTIVAGRELLAQLTDDQQYEVRWLRDGAHGPMVMDAYRAGPAVPGYSIIEERQDFCRVQITFAAAPYGRSDIRENLWFPDGAVGGPTPPAYSPWIAVDDYSTVESLTDPGAWFRANRPGLSPGNRYPWSARWSPIYSDAYSPVYHRILPGGWGIPPATCIAGAPATDLPGSAQTWDMAGGYGQYPAVPYDVYDPADTTDPPEIITVTDVSAAPTWQVTRGATPADHAPGFTALVVGETGGLDISGRQHMNLWVGLGNSNGQWRGGNLTFVFTLTDTTGTVIDFGGTFWLNSSDNWDQPIFTRISVPMPRGVTFGLLAEYIIRCPSFTNTARMGDMYLHLLGVAPNAEHWESTSIRSAVYTLRPEGTARAPMSLRAQTPAGRYGNTLEFGPSDAGYLWAPPPDLISAPDGTPDSVQVRVRAGGGAGGTLTTTAPTIMSGGGGGGGVAGDDHYPLVRNDDGTFPPITPFQVGWGASPSTVAAPPPGQSSQFGTLTATGGDTPPTNTTSAAGPGRGLFPAPIRYTGGWSATPTYAPNPVNGAGGGGGAAGDAGDGGNANGQNGGVGGLGGGGRGGGGRSPFEDGSGNPGQAPGGGGGGVTRRTTNLPTTLGARGAGGKISVSYVVSNVRMQALLLHMPNPDSGATFVPVINVGDGALVPDGNDPASQFVPVSPHPGIPVKYDGTYAVALTAAYWDNPTAPRTLTIRCTQISSLDPTQPRGDVGLQWQGLIPMSDPQLASGLIPMGNLTLPLRWLPPDNQDNYYAFSVDSTNRADRFMDILLLDVTGTTVGLIDSHWESDGSTIAFRPGYTTWYIDEPESGQSFGGILGSNYGRTSAVSSTDAISSVSGGPFMLEPGKENLLLAYSPQGDGVYDPTRPPDPGSNPLGFLGAPALAGDYYPRWWFDRSDDNLTTPQDQTVLRRRALAPAVQRPAETGPPAPPPRAPASGGT